MIEGPAQAEPFAYIPNIVDGEVSVLDTAANTVVATVPVGRLPSAFGQFIGQSLPTFSKIFAPMPTAAGGMSTLTFSISNTASTVAPNLVLTDNLPTGVEITTPCNSTTSCTGGGQRPQPQRRYGASCTVNVDVTSSTAGTHVNITGDLTSFLKNSETVSDTLTVAPPSLGPLLDIPTVPQWGMVLLTLALLTMATWQLAGRPAEGGAADFLFNRSQWFTTLLLGQGSATLGLLLYAALVGPLVPHEGMGAFLAGMLLGMRVEG